MKADQGNELTYAEKFQLNPIDFEDIPIERDACQFSIRTWKRLSESGIRTAGDLLRTKESELRKINGFGQKCADEVIVFLQVLAEKPSEIMKVPVELPSPTEKLNFYREKGVPWRPEIKKLKGQRKWKNFWMRLWLNSVRSDFQSEGRRN